MIILGLSGEYLHDAAACIVKDGRLVAYGEEERFCTKKHAIGEAPICSILHCLESQNLTLDDIDYIALSWDQDIVKSEVLNKLLQVPNLKGINKKNILSFGNHLSLAATGFYTSGFENALIIVVNGSSENISTSLFTANKDAIKMIKNFDASQSLGYFYTAAGVYLGFDMWDESKTMGLSAYGNAIYDFPITLTEDGYKVDISVAPGDITKNMIQAWLKKMSKLFGVPAQASYEYNKLKASISKPPIDFSQKQLDIAASVQKKLDDIILHLIKQYTHITGLQNVVISGGVAQNSTTVGNLYYSGIVDQLHVPIAPNASGGCIGAAMLAYSREYKISPTNIETPYWGPEFTDEEIERELKRRKIKYRYCKCKAQAAAEFVANNHIIGWFQGKSEMGARTLGNRSIIANPANPKMKEQMNSMVKYRENWRPVATSVLEEQMHWLIQDGHYSPFMNKALKATKAAIEQVNSIVHADNSVLPQIVRKEINPDWYSLIKCFYEKTGIPCIMHTSLNEKGKAICNTPANAIDTFYSCGLEVLIIGNFIIEKG